MSIHLYRHVTGIFCQNTWVIVNELTASAVLIDAGADIETIIQGLEHKGIRLEALLITHAHLDHVFGLTALRSRYPVLICLHENDADLLKALPEQGKRFGYVMPPPPAPDMLLEDGMVLDFAGIEFRILHTPGHTSGSMSILWQEGIFTGDMLIRSEFDKATKGLRKWERSLTKLFCMLPNETPVFPGHGETSTIGAFKLKFPTQAAAHNPLNGKPNRL